MDDGLPRGVWSADGTRLVRGDVVGGKPRLTLCLPSHGEVVLALGATRHLVLGECDLVLGARGERLACSTAIDWRRPAEIPALDRPGALPAGAGTAILNLLAWQAARAGRGPLRYRGPYPSHALWRTLQASFRVGDPAAQTEDRFTADAERRAISGSRAEIDVDFHPEPHAWTFTGPDVCVQRRAGVERVYVAGRAYAPGRAELRQLRKRGDELVACVVLGSRVWIEVLALDGQGIPRGQARALPAAPKDLVGTPLPEPVVTVLGEVLTARAPALLRAAMRPALAASTFRWGDTGPDLVRWLDDALELHAGMVQALPTEPTELLGVLVQLVERPIHRRASRLLADVWSSRERDAL